MSGAAPRKAYILCRFACQSPLYQPWLDELPVPVEVVEFERHQWQPPDDAAIVITHMHYRWEDVHVLRATTEGRRVPVLILADGILEYRNTWRHPGLADGAVFQPVVGHKLACIGRAQARFVESWGNVGLCEVVGLPRLDGMIRQRWPETARGGPFRLLVATARRPSFEASQREVVLRSLLDLKQRLEKAPEVAGRPVEVTWRLTDGLGHDLRLQPEGGRATGTAGGTSADAPLGGGSSPVSRPPLAGVLAGVDAVITTPSTLQLEAALAGRPTALLDYHNSPHYVPAAWTIGAPTQIDPVLDELADPPPARMLFQETVLHDNLECRTPATGRLLQLIAAMIEAGERCRREGRPLNLPLRILQDPQAGHQVVPEGFDPAQLHPANPAFHTRDVRLLQAELSQAIARLGSMPEDLLKRGRQIEGLRCRIEGLRDRLRQRTERLVAVRAANKRLRSRVETLRQALHEAGRPTGEDEGEAGPTRMPSRWTRDRDDRNPQIGE